MFASKAKSAARADIGMAQEVYLARIPPGSAQSIRKSSSWSAPPAICPGANCCRACFISRAPDLSPAVALSAFRWMRSTRTVFAISRARRSTSFPPGPFTDADWTAFAETLDYVPLRSRRRRAESRGSAGGDGTRRREPPPALSERAARTRPCRRCVCWPTPVWSSARASSWKSRLAPTWRAPWR